MTNSVNGDNLVTALISGTSAAMLTAMVTFPFDSLKTQLQISDSAYMAKWNAPSNSPTSIAQLFKGSSALVLGAAVKNGTRLILYNWLSQFMSLDSHPGDLGMKTTAPRIVIAGAISGFFETLVLIPFENIKINMIQNMMLSNEVKDTSAMTPVKPPTSTRNTSQPNVFKRQYVLPNAYYSAETIAQATGKTLRFSHSQAHVNATVEAMKKHYNKHPSMTFSSMAREMYAVRGLHAFTAGALITMVRQMAVATLWMWTYNAARQALDPHSSSQNWFGHSHTAAELLGLHLLSCGAVIMTTQPLDVIKTTMQSKNGKFVYKDSLTAAYRIVIQQGFKALYRGAFPRAIKVLVSGGLTAAVYSQVEKLTVHVGKQKVFNNH